MKEIDWVGLKMCSYQAKLFKMSKDRASRSSKIFIRRFMNSDLASRMDNPAFYFGAEDVYSAFFTLEEEYGPSSYGKEKFSADELHWIGYIYRYWVSVSGRSSKSL